MPRKKTKRPIRRKYERREVKNRTGEVQKVKNYTKTYKKKPKTVYASSRDYDFLRHLRVVTRWMMKTHDIKRAELETLLYFYPMGVFTKTEFYFYTKTVTNYQTYLFNEFVEKGYIVQWRKRGNGHKSDLYVLSHKAKHLCDSMHKYMLGEKPLPEEGKNDLSKIGDKRVDKYYMDVIKKMNRDRLKKED